MEYEREEPIQNIMGFKQQGFTSPVVETEQQRFVRYVMESEQQELIGDIFDSEEQELIRHIMEYEQQELIGNMERVDYANPESMFTKVVEIFKSYTEGSKYVDYEFPGIKYTDYGSPFMEMMGTYSGCGRF